jgi:hypothetical protein
MDTGRVAHTHPSLCDGGKVYLRTLRLTAGAVGAAPLQPEAMVLWFYPGRNSGHEFLYPAADQKELAQIKRHTVIATTTSPAKDKQHVVAEGD